MESTNQPAGRSDADLLHRALSGEEAAFLLLYQRLKGGIFRYAFYMTNSTSTAEEVTQEVFIALLKEGRNYRPDRGDVGAFAFGIARNFVHRIERRERVYQALPPDQPLETLSASLISESDALAGQVIRNEVVELVRSSVAALCANSLTQTRLSGSNAPSAQSARASVGRMRCWRKS
jgi:RNA polymerase sigma-70 factor, ECF subfamily